MSSYLNFYIMPKAENSQPLYLISFSRSSEVYQYFNDNINPSFIGMGEETNYTEVTSENIHRVLEDLNNDISKAQKRVTEYAKHVNGNAELIEDILSQKEYIEDLEWALHKIEFIQDLVKEISFGYTGYNKILCNIG